MLELLLKLVDRFIQLSSVRQTDRRLLVKDFLDPLIADLEAVHGAYLESFACYLDLVASDRTELTNNHPVFQRITRDVALSEGARQRLIALSVNGTISQLRPVLRAVQKYVSKTDYMRLDQLEPGRSFLLDPHRENPTRRIVCANLMLIAEQPWDAQRKRELARQYLEVMVLALQKEYGAVHATAAGARLELLRP